MNKVSKGLMVLVLAVSLTALGGCSASPESDETQSDIQAEEAEQGAENEGQEEEVEIDSSSESNEYKIVGAPGDEKTFENQENISLGQVVTNENFELVFTEIEVVDEIVPPQAASNGASDTYWVMERQDGYRYVVARGTVTNQTDETLEVGVDGITTGTSPILGTRGVLFYSQSDDMLYEGVLWGLEEDGTDFGAIEIPAGSSCEISAIACLPTELTESVSGSKYFILLNDDLSEGRVAEGLGNVGEHLDADNAYCLVL